MRHQYSGKKFGNGQDANEALTRKLLINFVRHGHITTTITKGKHLKAHLDRLIALSKKSTQASHNMMLKALGDVALVETIERSSASFAKRESGFTTHERLGRRMSDGTMMVRISWTEPVVLEPKPAKATKKAVAAEKKEPAKKADAKTAAPKKAVKKEVSEK